MIHRTIRGKLGESFAVLQLEQDGYEILARNWRSGRMEIDIIAQKNDVIAFIEVKLRAEDAWVAPETTVCQAQKRRIVLAAAAYLKEYGLYNKGALQPRFDIFAITAGRGNSSVVQSFFHFKSAYDLEGLNVFI